MAINLTKDHHLLTRNLKLNGNYLSNDGGDEGITIDNDGVVTASSQIDIGNMSLTASELDIAGGNLTIDVTGDIALSADGGNVTLDDGSTTVFDFDVNSVALKIMDDADTGDYFSIGVAANGVTTLTTVDNDGAGANLTFVADGTISFTTATSDPAGIITLSGITTVINPVTKTVSGTSDTTLLLAESLNLDSGNAGGSDVHYGLRYIQTQADLTGWDDVYLMHLYGGDAARTFAVRADGKVGIGVADPDTALEVMVDGSPQLKLSKDATDYLTFEAGPTAEITATNNIDLNVGAGTNFRIYEDVYLRFLFSNSGSHTKFQMNSAASISDNFQIECQTEGATVISTTDADTAVAHLTIVADGHVEFDGCAAGFDLEEETFSGDDLLASGSGTGGIHDTHIDFRIGNKIYLQTTASMNQINLIFPAVSGNFLLNTRSDGDWSIGDWKVWESDLTAATVTDVAWPGGTQPDNTDTGRDIFSFYWDADNQICYGVASLAFALPS